MPGKRLPTELHPGLRLPSGGASVAGKASSSVKDTVESNGVDPTKVFISYVVLKGEASYPVLSKPC